MPNDTTVHAPYNFVPFSEKILEYKEEVPAHDSVDPDLKTGEIHVTLTADTPVFVSDGNRDDPHFFRGPDGRFMLPGSTIRGMVRANMQILGFGLIRVGEDLEDQRLFYRRLADKNGTVFEALKKYYGELLDVKQEWRNGKPYATPRAVKAGYLRKVGDGYQIQPVTGTFLRVSRKHRDVLQFGSEPSRAVPVSFTATDKRVNRICPGAVKGMERGVLVYTGRPVGKKPNPLYLFPEADESARPVILEEDALLNATDQELRANFLRGGGHDPEFWSLPKAGESKPVFYARYQGHTYFGMSLFLRLRYLNSIAKGLPGSHRARQASPDFLDWPRAILGWAGNDSSRRSRVSFGDFPARGDPQELPLVETVLGNPKISYYPGYVVDGEHYNQEGFQLRGYKQYWLKEAQAVPTDKKNTASRLRPLPAGTAFSGVIRYRNLRPEELGLLLWALRLEEGCYQSVGMGKPYGYGRMKLSIDSLREYDMAALYRPGGLCSGPITADPEAVQRYIDVYDAAAAKAMHLKEPKKKPSITSRDEIQDFFYLRRTIRHGDEVSYMTLPEYQNAGSPLPDTRTFRQESEQAERARAEAAPEDNSLEAMKAMLARKFNSR